MKHHVEFTGTLESPLFIASQRQSRVPDCVDHVPGSTLRGALLSTYRRRHGEDEVFERLLAPGRNRFPFLYPGGPDSFPAPRSTLTCKRSGAVHGLVDELVDRWLASSADHGSQAMKTHDDLHRCRVCAQARAPLRGYIRGTEPVEPPVRTQRVNVGIDRRTGTAATHVLFGSQSIEPLSPDDAGGWQPVVLGGRGALHPDDVAVIESLCNEPLFLGKQRSRGFGRTTLRVRMREAEQRKEEIVRNSRLLADRLGDRQGTWFTLDVTTPLLAFDQYLRPTTDPRHWLGSELDCRVAVMLTRTTMVSGWDMACGAPKDDHQALAPGSVLLCNSGLDKESLAESLVTMEREGLGERTDEGFGQVRANIALRFEHEVDS